MSDEETTGRPEGLVAPLKAIRAKCLDCSAGSSNEAKLCPVLECSLYPYRFGRRPYKTERKAGNIDNLRAWREQQKEAIFAEQE